MTEHTGCCLSAMMMSHPSGHAARVGARRIGRLHRAGRPRVTAASDSEIFVGPHELSGLLRNTLLQRLSRPTLPGRNTGPTMCNRRVIGSHTWQKLY